METQHWVIVLDSDNVKSIVFRSGSNLCFHACVLYIAITQHALGSRLRVVYSHGVKAKDSDRSNDWDCQA